ncbi:MAG: VOC family protein [Bacteroidetes bacterium]|nr:VOC family protein [Bacteroidota bacterium]
MKDFIKGAAPVLPCQDVDAAIDYYKNKLGFDKTWVHQGFYGGAYNGSAEFHFHKAQSEIHPIIVYCFVDKVDDVYEFVKSNGVEITNELTNQVYGLRDFTIKDLNGHFISFASQIEK